MLTSGPRGTKDILPDSSGYWQYVEKIIREVCQNFAYQEIRTPVFEHTELFLRGIGDTTDIVEKEMYTFTDRAKRSITLRPENTAAVVRSYLEHKLYSGPQPTKLYYIGPMFDMIGRKPDVIASFISLALKLLVRRDRELTLKLSV